MMGPNRLRRLLILADAVRVAKRQNQSLAQLQRRSGLFKVFGIFVTTLAIAFGHWTSFAFAAPSPSFIKGIRGRRLSTRRLLVAKVAYVSECYARLKPLTNKVFKRWWFFSLALIKAQSR